MIASDFQSRRNRIPPISSPTIPPVARIHEPRHRRVITRDSGSRESARYLSTSLVMASLRGKSGETDRVVRLRDLIVKVRARHRNRTALPILSRYDTLRSPPRGSEITGWSRAIVTFCEQTCARRAIEIAPITDFVLSVVSCALAIDRDNAPALLPAISF